MLESSGPSVGDVQISTLWGAAQFMLLTPYCSCDKIKEDGMGGAYGTHGGEEKCMQSFGGEFLRKRHLGRRRCKWEVSIRMDFKEI